MKIALFCFSDAGCRLAGRLCDLLGILRTEVHTSEKFAARYGYTPHKSVCADAGGIFSSYGALIFIGACGIAVRAVAPYLKSKAKDTAVLCIDDQGTYVIPLLSGHIGGANALARRVAALTGAQAVITTATDICGRFSCDAWAIEHNCAISSLKTAKDVSAAILEGEVGICSEYPLPAALWPGLHQAPGGETGIYIGIRRCSPYQKTLRLIPRIVTVGIGCRRGTCAPVIRRAVAHVFSEQKIDLRAICAVASIDVKRDEHGLLEYAASLRAPLRFYSAAELDALPGSFDESAFVRAAVGVGNVCERAAVYEGGRLLIRKTAVDGVTVAAAAGEWGILHE